MDDKGKKDANALGIANVGGVFVVLVCGLVLSLIVAILEFSWKARRRRGEEKVEVAISVLFWFCFVIFRSIRFNLDLCIRIIIMWQWLILCLSSYTFLTCLILVFYV